MTAVANVKAALIIAHPGHELCVYGWVENARPTVFVLTDGSGRSGVSRLSSTTNILCGAGASRGSIYGCFTDLEFYAAILESDFGLFERLVVELAQALVREDIECVAGDASEGYNPIHDICRVVIDAAVELAIRISGRPIVNRDFLLFGRHDTYPEELRANAIWLTLNDDLLMRKLTAARTYPELKSEVHGLLDKKMPEALQAFPEMSSHIDEVLSVMGSEAYRVECLRPTTSAAKRNNSAQEVPFYEQYGEKLVSAGVYRQTIRYSDHIVPLAAAISRFVDGKTERPPAVLGLNGATI